MKKYKIVRVEVEQAESIFCNGCGKSIDLTPYADNHISVEKKWGYGSEWDGETHSFDLCLDCYRKIISQFVLKAEKTKEP